MKRHYLPTGRQCIVCGHPDWNNSTLNVRWYVEDGLVKTEFSSSALQMGYKDLIHGGIISSLIDEALCWVAGVHCQEHFITGTLSVKFRQPIPVGSTLRISGEFHRYNGKYAECSATVSTPELGLCAQGTGSFFPVPREKALASADYWTFLPGDLDILSTQNVKVD